MTEPAAVDVGALPLRPWHLVVINVLVAAAITLLTVYSTFGTAVGRSTGATVLVWLLALAVSIPLIFRSRWPIPVLGLVLTLVITAVLLGMSASATVLAVALAIYPVALSAGPRRSAAALGAALLGVTLAAVLGVLVLAPHFSVVPPNAEVFKTDLLSSLIFSWLAIGAGWVLGRSFQARREYAVQLAEHRAHQAVAEERLRIAREMHDVVAHSMGVIVMKAAVANHVYETRPEESREALAVIESVGRAALADIQHALGSLRSEGQADLAPSPSLDDVPGLIENARLADVQVKLERGPIPALPSAVQLSAYRIVQEALTNIVKHAAPARCTVRITAESGELHLAVINEGASSRPAGKPGHGLIGMRERAALHHGTLVAGRQPNGGFAVHARLPYQVGSPHG
ncbi:MAG: sensor histidine kinase [Actinomycetota bacterium]|nr:sensor histidine kinase [Actinomycetota bacterium]